MNRQEFRKAQRERVRAAQKIIAQAMGLPKAFIQYAARHGVMPEDIRNTRLKFPD